MILCRYVLPDGAIKERFFTFIDIYGHTAEYLCKVVLETLDKWGIDIKNCRGQSYDNASNMSGKYSGLQARIKQKSPTAFYVPCSSHSLNLIGNSAADSSTTSTSFFNIVQLVYNFFSDSTFRWSVLMKHLKPNSTVVKAINATRWSARAEAVMSQKNNDKEIKLALAELAFDTDQREGTRNEAKSILSKLNEYENVLLLNLWNKLLQRIQSTSKSLQNSSLCLNTCVTLLHSLKSFVLEVRNSFTEIERESSLMMEEKDIVYKQNIRRKVKKKIFHDEIRSNETCLNGRQKFITSTYNVICDKLCAEIDKRIESYIQINEMFGLFIDPKNSSEDAINRMIENLITTYKDDIHPDLFRDEVLQFLDISKKENLNCPKEMHDYIKKGLESTFPNVQTILQIYLTLAVSNATGERSFSCLNILKDFLRNTIGQVKMANLAILSIEKEAMEKCNYDEQIDEFSMKKSRKKVL